MSDVSRLASIKYHYETYREIFPLDFAWLIAQIERTEDWRRKEIAAADYAYTRAHPLEVLNDLTVDTEE